MTKNCGDALLVAPAVHEVDQRIGDGDAVDESARHLLAQLVAPAQRQEAALAQAHILEDVLEGDAGEIAVRILERGIVLQPVDERLVRQRKIELIGVRLDRGPSHELRQHALVDAGSPRLLRRDVAPRLPRDGAQLVLQRALEILDADLVRANLRQRAAPEIAKHGTDAPDRKADHQDREQGLGHHTRGATS